MSAPVVYVDQYKGSTRICAEDDGSLMVEIPVIIPEQYHVLMIRCFTAGWQGGERFGRHEQAEKIRKTLREWIGL